MIDYQTIIDILLNSEAGEYIPDGMSCSFPVATRDSSGNVIDNYFIYGVEMPSGIASSPTAYIGMHTETENIVYYREAEEIRFPAETSFEALSYEEYKCLTMQYERLYPAVRSFAFSPVLRAEDRRLLLDYFDIQCRLFAGHMRYYRSIAPTFYSWMIRMLVPDISFLSLCEEGQGDWDKLQQYLDMTGADNEDQKMILGMTEVEFAAWKNQGNNILRRIVHSRQMGEDFRKYQNMSEDQLRAARSYDPAAIDKIKHEDS